MDTGVIAVVALVAAAGGAVLGALVRSFWASQAIKAATSEARRIEAEARARQKELILEAKDEKLRMQREAEEEARARRGELSGLESRLLQRDEQLDQRSACSSSVTALLDRSASRQDPREGPGPPRAVAASNEFGYGRRRRAGDPDRGRSRGREHDAVKLARAIERSAREEGRTRPANRDHAMQRVAADHTAEPPVRVHLPSDEMKGGSSVAKSQHPALEQATDRLITTTRRDRDPVWLRPVRARSLASRSPSSSPMAGSTRAASRRSSPRPAPRSTSSSARPASRRPTTPGSRDCTRSWSSSSAA